MLLGPIEMNFATCNVLANIVEYSIKLTYMGMDKMEVLLDQHKYMNCICLKTGTTERNGVLPTREDSFNGNSGTCDRQFRLRHMKLLKYLPGIHRMLHADFV